MKDSDIELVKAHCTVLLESKDIHLRPLREQRLTRAMNTILNKQIDEELMSAAGRRRRANTPW